MVMAKDWSWLAQRQKTVKLLPCPFCGSTELYTGPNDAMSWCVQCSKTTCGARIVVQLPERRPRSAATLRHVYVWCLNRAVKRWNNRKEADVGTN